MKNLGTIKKLGLVSSAAIFSLTALPAKAVCPVCIVAVGAGLGLSRYLGVDDTISGVWIGGLTAGTAIWTINWLNKKNWNLGNKLTRNIIIVIAYYLMIFWPLISRDLIGHPFNKIYGIDKIAFGAFFGTLVFVSFDKGYLYLKKKNNDHAYFPFQKVVMPVAALTILSVIFYFLTK
ncbi:MAG TPA: hypothetical protein VFD16_02495 [Candidatus Saccharimonadales bacterium]|nr:hypothetical protein [Candidatus Saccharimonadales bacterium]